MSTLNYQPAILQSFAEKLYRRASWTVFQATMTGILAGIIAGLYAAYLAKAPASMEITILAPLFGLIGFVIGQARAFSLRVQAQTMLCQKQIEENTRQNATRPTTAVLSA